MLTNHFISPSTKKLKYCKLAFYVMFENILVFKSPLRSCYFLLVSSYLKDQTRTVINKNNFSKINMCGSGIAPLQNQWFPTYLDS